MIYNKRLWVIFLIQQCLSISFVDPSAYFIFSICYKALREKCPDTEFFLVRIFLHWDWIRRDMEFLSASSPNTGKYGPEKTLYLDTFQAVRIYAGLDVSLGANISNSFCCNQCDFIPALVDHW